MAEIPEPREGHGLDDTGVAAAPAPEGLVEQLRAADERLRTAEEEIRAQRAEIEQHVAAAAQQQERNVLLVPTPAFITDRRGLIKAANGAAAALLGTRAERLQGTSVFELITPDSRRELHRLFDSHDPPSGPYLCHLDLAPGNPGGANVGPVEPVPVGITVLPVPNVADEMTWVLLPSEDADRAGGDADLTVALAQLAALPPVTGNIRGYLQGAAAVLAGHVSSASDVSIVVGAVEAPDVLGASSARAQRLDGLQVAAEEGPSVIAFDSGAVIESQALASDPRWPRLARRVSPGDGGAMAAPLLDASSGPLPFGVVTVYLPIRPWHPSLAQRLPLLAAVITAGVQVLLSRADMAQLVANLRIALESRATIEQAKGIIMATRHCDADSAFAHLAERSSRQHRKLRDVARDVIDGIRQ